MEQSAYLTYLAVKSSSLGGVGVFATKLFTPNDLIEICPILVLERSVWGLSAALDDHVVSLSSYRTPIGLPLGYGALYNHGEPPNADWKVDEESLVMEVRAAKQIEPGDEILIYYGEAFFEARGIPNIASNLNSKTL